MNLAIAGLTTMFSLKSAAIPGVNNVASPANSTQGPSHLSPMLPVYSVTCLPGCSAPRRSSNQPRPCLALYPIEYLVDRFLLSSGEPVVCARSAWLVGSRLIRTINDDRRKALSQLLCGTEKVGWAQILDVVHDADASPCCPPTCVSEA